MKNHYDGKGPILSYKEWAEKYKDAITKETSSIGVQNCIIRGDFHDEEDYAVIVLHDQYEKLMEEMTYPPKEAEETPYKPVTDDEGDWELEDEMNWTNFEDWLEKKHFG